MLEIPGPGVSYEKEVTRRSNIGQEVVEMVQDFKAGVWRVHHFVKGKEVVSFAENMIKWKLSSKPNIVHKF